MLHLQTVIYHLYCVNNQNNAIHDDGETDDSWFCENCLSLPFSQLETDELRNEVKPDYNLHDAIRARLDHAASNPLDPKDYNEDIHTDHDIDPDANFLLSQTLNDKCQYYYEDSFNNLISQEDIKNELSLIHFNMRSIKKQT